MIRNLKASESNGFHRSGRRKPWKSVTFLLFEMDGSGHGSPSKNRKRRVCGKGSADKGQRRRAARFHRHLSAGYYVASSPVALRPPHPWLELAIEVWRLRCSVFRGTPMAFFCVHFKEQKCYGFSRFSAPASMETVRLACF